MSEKFPSLYETQKKPAATFLMANWPAITGIAISVAGLIAMIMIYTANLNIKAPPLHASLDSAQRLVNGINAAHAPGQPPATVESTFAEDGLPGFTGLVLRSSNGGRAIGWVTPDGRHLVLGGLLTDAAGVNLSAKAFMSRIGNEGAAGEGRPDGKSSSEKLGGEKLGGELKTALGSLDGFTTPASAVTGGTIYVFVDPRCPACKTFWRQTKALAAKGSLTASIRWLPIAILGDESEALAAKMLAAAEPDRHLFFDGNPPAPDQNPRPGTEQTKSAEQSRIIFRRFAEAFPEGRAGTPLLAWVTADGRVRASSGVPSPTEFDALAKEAAK